MWHPEIWSIGLLIKIKGTAFTYDALKLMLLLHVHSESPHSLSLTAFYVGQFIIIIIIIIILLLNKSKLIQYNA